ncbi:MAG: hypothetical protein K1X29_06510 [Bdellovibrionales bacterium]|nr:hypothetical protein [Bdellovibrionales bacterium]
MNIKGLTHSIPPIDSRLKTDGKESVRLNQSSDRDGQGRRDPQEQELKRHLTEEEFNNALQTLKEFPGMQIHQLKVRVEQLEDCRVIFIEDPSGHIVRRLSEAELWASTRNKEKSAGHLFDKAG